MRGEFDQLLAVRLDDEVRRLDLRSGPTSGGSSATDTSRPPGRITAGERSSSSPPTVSNTRSTGSSASSNRRSSRRAPRARRTPGQLRARRRRRADHVGAAPARELGREVADAAGRSVDQHPLALLQSPVIEQPLPGAERGQGDGGALLVAERLRLGSEERGPDDDVLGRGAVAIEVGERPHRVTDRQRVDIGPDGGHLARELVRRDRGQPIHRPSELVRRDRGGMDPDERFARLRAAASRSARARALPARRLRGAGSPTSRARCSARSSSSECLLPIGRCAV